MTKITHSFVDPVLDDPLIVGVRPSNWNADHTVDFVGSPIAAIAPTITGPELISNPSFVANDTGWTIGDATQTTWSSGLFSTTCTAIPPNFSIVQWVSTPVNLVAGKWYAITIHQTISGDDTAVYFANSSGYYSSINETGNHTFYVESDFTGTDTLFVDFDFYNTGATRLLTFVSMKACTTPTPALVIKDIFGDTDWTVGGIDVTQRDLAIGQNALINATVADGANIAFGPHALENITTGGANVVVGNGGFSLTTGARNFALGSVSLAQATTQTDNVAIGNSSMAYSRTANFNVGVGSSTLEFSQGDFNIGIGYDAIFGGNGTYTGSRNIAIGNAVFYNLTSGSGNVAIGFQNISNGGLGDKILTGNRNILIGSVAIDFVTSPVNPSSDVSDFLNIGGVITGTMTTGPISILGQPKVRVTVQFDVSNNNVLANVPGLTVNVMAAQSYQFSATLFTVSNAGGGVQAAVGGTCSATAIIYEGQTTNAGSITQTRASSLGGAVGAVTAVTAARIDIEGLITVNTAGTLTIEFAQNVSNGTASSVLVGSYMLVQQIA